MCLFLSPIRTVIIGITLNFNTGNNGNGLRNVTCKQTFINVQRYVKQGSHFSGLTKFPDFSSIFCHFSSIFVMFCFF